MYGLVNTAVAQLCREVGGEATWQAVRRRADVPDAFVGMTAYDDDVTYRLVGAASEVLDLPADEVLRAFGRYWVRYTAHEGWGPLLQAAGDSLPEVLHGLDALHARVRLMMPALRPPSFRCDELSEDRLHLRYYSDRPGLAPMVVGLVEGLAEVLGTTAHVEHVVRGDADRPDEFVVHHRTAVPDALPERRQPEVSR